MRATEYTVGKLRASRCPARCFSATAYTYAVDLRADEAITAGAQSVVFSKPVSVYVDNFLNFPVGLTVPAGYYWLGKHHLPHQGIQWAKNLAANLGRGVGGSDAANAAKVIGGAAGAGGGQMVWIKRLRVPVSMPALSVIEFNLGPGAAREATDATDRPFLEAMFQAQSLTKVIFASRSVLQQRIEFRDYKPSELTALSPKANEHIFKAARSGDRVAAVLDGHDAIALLGTFGYVGSELCSEIIHEIPAAWLDYMNSVLSTLSSAIIIGHDFDPVFLLQVRAPASR